MDVDGNEKKQTMRSLLGGNSKRLSLNGAKPHLKLQQAWDREAVAEQMDEALVESADDKSLDGMNADVGSPVVTRGPATFETSIQDRIVSGTGIGCER